MYIIFQRNKFETNSLGMFISLNKRISRAHKDNNLKMRN